MNFLLNGMVELDFNQLVAINGGCSGSCSGIGVASYIKPNTPITVNPPVVGTPYSSSGNCNNTYVIYKNSDISTAIQKNLDKKTNSYKAGVNDCDIWVEKVLKTAGLDISKTWGNASSTSVAGHEKKLAGLTTDYAKQGWSVVLMTDSDKYSTDHCGLAKVNGDGSVYFYQNTKSNGGPVVEKYKSVSAFEKAYAYNDFDYWKISN